MQSLAEVFLQRSWQLTGSDLNAAKALWLGARGVTLFDGHDSRQINDSQQLVIYSDAVNADNVERREATRLGLPQCSYPQAVADLMAEHRGLAVAGTHGKSTTSAMIAEIMTCAGLDPTVVYGASPLAGGSGGRAGKGRWVVAEACEYRANFLRMKPEIAVVLSIEPDHFDYYDSRADVEEAFRQFLKNTALGGAVVASADCPATLRVLAAARSPATTFGFAAGADWRPKNVRHWRGRYQFEIERLGRTFCQVVLGVPGGHQVGNALAAAAASHAAGASPAAIAVGLGRFRGLRRRLEHVGQVGGIDLLDDYAHHPTEVRATLTAVRLMYPGRRVWCVFQPHQVSRTVALADEFADSLLVADRIAVTEVYAARESVSTEPRVAAENLIRRVRVLGGMVLPDCRAETILSDMTAAVRPGDVVITLGAGDIRKECNEFADRIRAHRAAG